MIAAILLSQLGNIGSVVWYMPVASNTLFRDFGLAVFLACVAPPPFPFTMVIAAAAALDLSRLRICAVNFFARGIRFAVLSLLAIKYGRHILEVANSKAFRLTMAGFILLCLAGSALSIYTWIKNVRSGRKPAKAS